MFKVISGDVVDNSFMVIQPRLAAKPGPLHATFN
jgi:hypothetical protein